MAKRQVHAPPALAGGGLQRVRAHVSGDAPREGAVEVIRTSLRELLQECDYEFEAGATRRFKRNLAPFPEFAVPAVVPSLSSRRVLTTEWMSGQARHRRSNWAPQHCRCCGDR